MADLFDMSKGTLHFLGQINIVFKDHVILKSLISWPTPDGHQNPLSCIICRERARFPYVVGAIDGMFQSADLLHLGNP